jgi:hypothetical protein
MVSQLQELAMTEGVVLLATLNRKPHSKILCKALGRELMI